MLMDYNHNVEVNTLEKGSCQKTGAFFLFGFKGDFNVPDSFCSKSGQNSAKTLFSLTTAVL